MQQNRSLLLPLLRALPRLAALVLALALAGCGPTPAPAATAQPATAQPAVIDTATAQPTQNGLYRVAYTSDLDPIAINKLHTWTIHVATAEGKPVEDATVTVTGGMPAHNHGMPTEPQTTPLANGDYKVEGMKFQMAGRWVVTVTVAAGDQQDSAAFNLDLK